jgi:methylmalonyl-CoA/ethylmalonyl-CoA epimerase
VGSTEDVGKGQEPTMVGMTRRRFLRNSAAVAAGGLGAMYLAGAGGTALAESTTTTIPPAAAAADTASAAVPTPIVTGVRDGGIYQIAIAVKNIEQTCWNYWNYLGIGPWMIFDWEAPTVVGRKYHGKLATKAKEKIALTMVGKIQLELVSPISGDSVYRDWIMEHGESLHHVNYLVPTVEQVFADGEAFESIGFPQLQNARFGQAVGGGAFNYIDTMNGLHVIWEPVHNAEKGIGDPDKLIPPNANAVSPAKIKITAINQLAIAVKDLEQVAWNYWNIMGVGPWIIFDWEWPLVKDRTYHGRKLWGRERIALTQLTDNTDPSVPVADRRTLQLELVQPIEGPSFYRDWIESAHGESLNHINYLVDSVEAVYEHGKTFEKMGFPQLQNAKFGPEGGPYGAFNYIDTMKKLFVVWEPVHNAENGIGDPDVTIPPPA